MIKVNKNIIDKKSFYYFAVSMGIDSVAGFLYLKNKSYNVIPIHVNHCLRPQNTLMEQKYLELCRYIGSEPKIFKGHKLKTELDCRNFRISSFSKLSNSHSKIITAHHLNDWVESYILNCIRGNPDHKNFSLVSRFENFFIIHPFLLTKKKDFETYLIRNNYFKFVVEDETNKNFKGSRRNWVRNFLIPQMKTQKLSLEKYAKRSITKLTEEFNLVKI